MVGRARRGVQPFQLKVVTLNVNGIRSAAKKGLFRWLAKQNADVVCLQELKCHEVDLDARIRGNLQILRRKPGTEFVLSFPSLV